MAKSLIEIRNGTENDIPALKKLLKISFQLKPESIDSFFSHPLFSWDYCFVALENNVIAAMLYVWPFQMTLRGETIPMGGIAYVATFPAYRRRGLVKRLLQAALEFMHTHEIPVSVLYPFKTSFYRRFGWGEGVFTRKLCFRAAELREFQVPLAIRVIPFTDDKITLVSNFYHNIAHKKKLTLKIRDENDWKRHLKGNYSVYFVENDEVVGYGIFHYKKDKLFVRDYICASANAFRALLAVMTLHKDQVNEIEFEIENELSNFPLSAITGDASSVVLKLEPSFMFRVVDVKHLFSFFNDISFSTIGDFNEQEFYITIIDNTAPWNDGIWAFRISNSKIVVQKHNKTEKKSQINLPIDIFSNLVLGLYPKFSEALPFLENVKVNDPHILSFLDSVFSYTNPRMLDFF